MNTGKYILGGVLIIVGISALTGFNIFRFILPLLLILLGWSILTGRRFRSRGFADEKRDESDSLNEVLVFSGAKREIVSTDFKNGKVVVVFGGGDFDLSNIKTTEHIILLEVHAVFGEIRMKVPKTWKVTQNVTSVMGAYKDNAQKGGSVKVKVTGSVVLGNVEIYN